MHTYSRTGRVLECDANNCNLVQFLSASESSKVLHQQMRVPIAPLHVRARRELVGFALRAANSDGIPIAQRCVDAAIRDSISAFEIGILTHVC